MDWITAILWLCIVGILFVISLNFLRQARGTDPGSIRRHTKLALFIMFAILGATKLFDLLFVNLGAVPEPVPFMVEGWDPNNPNLIMGLVVMSFYLVGFSVLLFVLEKHNLNTKYILTMVPLVVIIGAWILMGMGYTVDVFLEGLYQQEGSWLLLAFFLPRAFIPFSYLYLTLKTSGIYRKKSFALFFGHGLLTVFFVRQPVGAVFGQLRLLMPKLLVYILQYQVFSQACGRLEKRRTEDEAIGAHAGQFSKEVCPLCRGNVLQRVTTDDHVKTGIRKGQSNSATLHVHSPLR